MVGMGKKKILSLKEKQDRMVFSGGGGNLIGDRFSFSDLDGGRFFFNAVKEGDSVVFAADDEAESHLWVMALYRATGQSHKPAPPLTPSGKSSTIAKIQGGIFLCPPPPPLRKRGEKKTLVFLIRYGPGPEARHGGIHFRRSGQI